MVTCMHVLIYCQWLPATRQELSTLPMWWVFNIRKLTPPVLLIVSVWSSCYAANVFHIFLLLFLTRWRLCVCRCRMHKCGIPCPSVVLLKKHVLVMSFIGEDRNPALKLKDAKLLDAEYELAYDQCLQVCTVITHTLHHGLSRRYDGSLHCWWDLLCCNESNHQLTWVSTDFAQPDTWVRHKCACFMPSMLWA